MPARSYSQISLYEKCPRQYNLRYNERLPVEKAPQASRGTEIHQSVEDFFEHKTDELHPEIEHYHDWLRTLRNHYLRAEVAFCFNSDWEPIDWDSADGYIRGYIDGMIMLEDDKSELILYEWKTGNVYEDHAMQRMLYALAGLLLYPQYEEVEVISQYFDKHKTIGTTFPRVMVDGYKLMWDRKIEKLNSDPYWSANPGPHCNWCPYSKKKGGPCEFGG